MALTTDEITEIRLLSGDDCTPYTVSDTMLNYWQANGVTATCAFVVKVIQARLSKASRLVGSSGETMTTHPQVAQINTLLQYWKSNCVEALPVASIAEMSLGIDEESSDFTNP